jgi:ABC-type dipeptide/oligopeptide/nickel transport system permease component
MAVGIGLGAAARRGRFVDRLIAIGAVMAISGPGFVLGYLLLFLFGADIGS